MTGEKQIPFQIESVSPWTPKVQPDLQLQVQDVISWRRRHESAWYGRPGRTLLLSGQDHTMLKVKGAGFYNPPNVSYSGLKRTTVAVPTSDRPMPPLEIAFKRDLIHVDPSQEWPHLFEAVHSHSAPVGGMTVEVALNDQAIFAALQTAGLPSNSTASVFRYCDLNLNDQPMGVSVSILPPTALRITPYEIYCGWLEGQVSDADRKFLNSFQVESTDFDSAGRLEIIAKLARHVGSLIARFSYDAGLYRFSGSPDNWNIKADIEEPLFFSDVDTSRFLITVPPRQRPWEVVRNLLTALHQWTYFFLPALTHPESGYAHHLASQMTYMRSIIEGFFPNTREGNLDRTMSQISELLDPVHRATADEEPLGLRSGEYFLQKFYPRPVFYLAMLAAIAPLIEGSELEARFPETDMTIEGVRVYIRGSAANETHQQHFASYQPEEVIEIVDSLLPSGTAGQARADSCLLKMTCQD